MRKGHDGGEKKNVGDKKEKNYENSGHYVIASRSTDWNSSRSCQLPMVTFSLKNRRVILFLETFITPKSFNCVCIQANSFDMNKLSTIKLANKQNRVKIYSP